MNWGVGGFLEKLFKNINEEQMNSLELQMLFTVKAKNVKPVVRSGTRLNLFNSKHQIVFKAREATSQ